MIFLELEMKDLYSESLFYCISYFHCIKRIFLLDISSYYNLCSISVLGLSRPSEELPCHPVVLFSSIITFILCGCWFHRSSLVGRFFKACFVNINPDLFVQKCSNTVTRPSDCCAWGNFTGTLSPGSCYKFPSSGWTICMRSSCCFKHLQRGKRTAA